MKAISVGFGVFMGIIPLWGFQMLIAVALSFYFRLNKVLVLIASNVSFPPLIPIVLYLSHRTGKIWMGKDAVNLNFDKGLSIHVIYESFTLLNFVQYILGAITLAAVSSLVIGLCTFFILKIFKRNTQHG